VVAAVGNVGFGIVGVVVGFDGGIVVFVAGFGVGCSSFSVNDVSVDRIDV
jgi:hypothetical protein